MPSVEVKLAGNPFSAIPSLDGKWVFVSLTEGGRPGITVLHKEAMAWTITRAFSSRVGFAGLAMTHDGKTLIITNFSSRTIQFVDISDQLGAS